ncbi:benzoate 4-monooxygenase cytochrome P450 [Lentithecium fluviatile CBS 122367]|uniref:Benzoate 4-monooxygenase cytochrome P450 n=1 Tax=Lentithecium fluviatile CBS 122367 TaxID=1168545 RepID=A0A6G1IKP3_9PLEO|nr:benzoate 4-monooxygenase cytochrome P450 [Lentithecium fluviatile CBS 122367]
MHTMATVLSLALEHPVLAALAVPVVLLILSTVRSYYRLSHLPGPFLARFTNIPRFSWVLSNNAHNIHIALHRRYGPIVRFGPNMVSIGDPNEISQIYGFKKPWLKSDFYHALLMKPSGKPVPGIFAAQDEEIHRTLKRPVSGAYSMSTLVSFESYVDSTMDVFCTQLDARFAHDSKICDLGKWLQMFAFDVIGELTFSKRLGFLETGEDVNGVMGSIWGAFKQTSLATQMPWLDFVWINNPIRRFLRGNGVSPGGAFAMARVQERRDLHKSTDKNDWHINERDFLSRFLEIAAKENVPPYALSAWASSNITAGSDTTGIYLRTLFHSLLTHPHTLSKLVVELDAAASAAALSPLASWSQTRSLPYLDACIKEAGRLHPPFGLPYERVVPAPGATVCGKWLPAGTVVGMSAWVAHRDKALYGEDCDVWNPERWLSGGEEVRRARENGLLTFGAGTRSCMGKHIAYLEMYKVVATLLRRFEFDLVPPKEGGHWKVENRWFVMQEGLLVRLRERKTSASQAEKE